MPSLSSHEVQSEGKISFMNATTPSVAALNERRRNSAVWLGLILAIVALLSQGLFFVKVPGQGALPWLSLALATTAVILVLLGVKHAFFESKLYRGKIAGSIITVISVLVFAVTVFGFVTARKIPGTAGVPQVGQTSSGFHVVRYHRTTNFAGAVALHSGRERSSQSGAAGLLSRLLVTILQPRVTRYSEKPAKLRKRRRPPGCHQRGYT